MIVEFCCVCHEFTECYRYNREWLCKDCPKSAVDNIKDIEDVEPYQVMVKVKKDKPLGRPKGTTKPKVNKPPKATNIRPKKERISKEKTPIVRTPRKNYYKPKTDRRNQPSCMTTIRMFFKNNPNTVFKSPDLWDKFPGFTRTNVKNTLSLLSKYGEIYSRKINIKGTVSFSLYSTNPNNVKQNIPEENITQLVKYIKEHYPVTTKKLSETFGISPEAVTKRMKKIDEIDIFRYMNRNFYFPVVHKQESIDKIIENTEWSNQWTN